MGYLPLCVLILPIINFGKWPPSLRLNPDTFVAGQEIRAPVSTGRHRSLRREQEAHRQGTDSPLSAAGFQDERRKRGGQVWCIGNAPRPCHAQEGKKTECSLVLGTLYYFTPTNLAFTITSPCYRGDSYPIPPPFPPVGCLPSLPTEGMPRGQTQK